MFKNLDQYVAALEKAGELVRIQHPVDPVLEISEITDREAKSPGGGRALLFENPAGSSFPVLTNMMGSERRICLALGVERMEEITKRIDTLLGDVMTPKSSLMDKLRMLPLLTEAASWMPRTRSGRGECQQVVLQGKEASLAGLPVLQCWPHDGGLARSSTSAHGESPVGRKTTNGTGRFITLPLVHTLDPVTGTRNVGMYRMQLFDDRTTGMHWHRHKTGARHYDQYKRLGLQKMPVAVCLGGDPAYTYAATAPLPDGMDEYMLAGFLRSKPVELVKCLTNDLRVPADCDFVIEGYVDTAEPLAVEGDFGDHTGFYSLKDLYPQFHVTAVTHRRGAIYPATVVGVPPQEDVYFALASERIFLAPMRFAIAPELQDLWMPPEGVAHNIVVASIEKRYPGEGFKIANALWGAGQMMFNKFLIVTGAAAPSGDPALRSDEGYTQAGPAQGAPAPKARNFRELFDKMGEDLFTEPEEDDRIKTERDNRHKWLSAIAAGIDTFDPRRDTLFSRGTLDVLDHASPAIGFGGKLCIDLTAKLPEEGAQPYGQLPNPSEGLSTITGKDRRNFSETGKSVRTRAAVFNEGRLTGRALPKFRTVLTRTAEPSFSSANGVRVVIIFDDFVDIERLPLSTLAWLAAANTDPEHDIKIKDYNDGSESCLVVDARIKRRARPWPNVVTMSAGIIERIDEIWPSLGLGPLKESPSRRVMPLVRPGGAAIE